MNAQLYIDTLKLEPHPEGGYYKRIFEHSQQVEGRPLCTSIHYLLKDKDYSCWHRLHDADEQWFFHAGNPMTVIELIDNTIRYTTLSHNNPQHVVKANTWFAACLETPANNHFCLVSCSVSPGFIWNKFEMATSTDQLLSTNPVNDTNLLQSYMQN